MNAGMFLTSHEERLTFLEVVVSGANEDVDARVLDPIRGFGIIRLFR